MNISPARLLLCAALAAGQLDRTANGATDQSLRTGSPVTQVIVVFKTRFDIGYTDMATNVVQRYRTTMIDDALKVVDQNRSLPPEQQFVWTMPGWPATKILEDWPGQSPERQQRLAQAFKTGRFVVHALPFTTHTELFEPEDLVRGLGYSSRLSRRLGLDFPRDAKMTDVPCHSWILPTLLHHAGVDFLHLGCNPASSSPRVPPLFFWEGPDGSRLLTMYSAAGYGTGLVPPSDWPYRTWLALIQTGDNHGPPRPEEVQQLLNEAREKLPGVKVRIGRLSDFSDAILSEGAPIPVVRGDMPDTWIHGPLCDPAGAALARDIRPRLSIAEALQTQLAAWGVTPDSASRLAAAREQSLLYGEHTWGGSLSWVASYSKNTEFWQGAAWQEQRAAGRFQRLEASWAEHSAYIEKAVQLAEPVLEKELDLLAQAVNVPGDRVVVFNPLPWKRDGLVTLPGSATNAALKPVDSSTTLPTWHQEGSLSFVARDVPPCGYRTYRIVRAADSKPRVHVNESRRTIEGPFFRVTLDPAHGGIASILDRRTQREWVDTSAPQRFGQYLYERFDAKNVADYVRAYVKIDADWAVTELGKPGLPPAEQVPYRAASPSNCTMAFEQSPSAVTAVMSSSPDAPLSHAVTTRLTVYADLPYLDLEVIVHDKPADAWPEAGWICLPFKLDAPQFRVGRLGAIEDPVRDFVPGANHDLGAVHTGVALFDQQGSGVGLCPIDSPIVSLDRPGCFKYSTDFVPGRPTVFINLFNNQWSTNFRLWNSGTWRSRVRLWSYPHYQPAQSLVTPSLEAREPLLAARTDAPPGRRPATHQGLALSRAGVSVAAFGPNPDGNGLVLRLWEYAGQSGRCRVQLPHELSVDRVQPVDLRGRAVGEPIPLRNQAFDC